MAGRRGQGQAGVPPVFLYLGCNLGITAINHIFGVTQAGITQQIAATLELVLSQILLLTVLVTLPGSPLERAIRMVPRHPFALTCTRPRGSPPPPLPQPHHVVKTQSRNKRDRMPVMAESSRPSLAPNLFLAQGHLASNSRHASQDSITLPNVGDSWYHTDIDPNTPSRADQTAVSTASCHLPAI